MADASSAAASGAGSGAGAGGKAPTVAPYGSWASPISSEAIVAGLVGISEPRVSDKHVYWLESLPQEGGRVALLRAPVADGSGGVDILRGTSGDGEPEFNVRTRVHEYGGGAFAVASRGGGDVVVFTNFKDQRLFKAAPPAADGGASVEVTALTPATDAKTRFADGVIDLPRDRVIVVQEFHPSDKPSEVVNTIVAVPLAGTTLGDDGRPVVVELASGADFYSTPQLSPDGASLCWLQWDHPNMPWDSTSLFVAKFNEDGTIGEPTRIAGSADDSAGESVVQPQWGPDGSLFFLSDRTNWWNLYRVDASAVASGGEAEPVLAKASEFGGPAWRFGYKYFDVVSASTTLVSYSEGGFNVLATVEGATATPLPTSDSTSVGDLRVHASGLAFFTGGSPTKPRALYRLNLATKAVTVVASSFRGAAKSDGDESKEGSGTGFDSGYFATPEQVEFDAVDGQKSYAFFYPPTNKDFVAPDSEKPPVLVKLHGGPTSSTSTVFRLGIQYWTSRGFAVLDVNYGGSTGYGRKYRQRLRGTWGVVDVDDCCSAATAMADAGRVDPKRMCVTGGSAGGFTVLAALTMRDVFTAGASYYGVSSLAALATDTHKFESRYLDGLVGPWPEAKDVYTERSPITHAANLKVPVVFFQGTEDRVVPPDQATRMYEVVKSKGLATALVMFEGEGHGFRQSANIRRALDGEFAFYGHVFGFTPADAAAGVDPALPIVNA